MENKVITTEELERLKRLEEKQKERYRKQNMHTNSIYDRINFTVPVGKKKELEELAKSEGKTLNKYISEVMLLRLVNNDVNNALNNNTYADEYMFAIPDNLISRIKMFTDDVDAYVMAAIYERLSADAEAAKMSKVDHISIQPEKPSKPIFKPVTKEENEKFLDIIAKKRAEQGMRDDNAVKSEENLRIQEQKEVNKVLEKLKNRKGDDADFQKMKDEMENMISQITDQ